MLIKIRIGNSDVLLTPTQMDALLAVIEGVEVMSEDYVGKNKGGYYGHESNNVLRFEQFDTSKHLSTTIMSDLQLDKFRTLQAIRDNQGESND